MVLMIFIVNKLSVLLSLLFNAIVIHNYLPPCLLNTIIVPIIKDKQGNASDKDNYRPLAITCVISKVFEFLVLQRCKVFMHTSSNQFGFKSKLSTDLCIFALKQVIELNIITHIIVQYMLVFSTPVKLSIKSITGISLVNY